MDKNKIKENKKEDSKEESEDDEIQDEDNDENLEFMVDRTAERINRRDLEEIFPGLFGRGFVNLERDVRDIVINNRNNNVNNNIDTYEIKDNNARNEDYFSAKDYTSIQDYSANAFKADPQTSFVQGNEHEAFSMNRQPPELHGNNPNTQDRTYSGKEKKKMW